ncbi:MAG: isoleucine--tRNA ligase, partial [Planctomycetota bacterium]
MSAFSPAPKSPNFPQLEKEVLEFWDQHDIYQQSLKRRKGAPPFVFYEGPPTANGLPHPGHCLTRAIKDVFPRYKTMKGFRCDRKAGWDTHGLPVEVEVGKELGIHSKEQILEYGVEPFIQKCQQSVWRYMQQWEQLTRRIGFWVDLKDAYVTYHKSYVESVWWSLKTLFDRGLLYRGHKIVWWWAQGGTALSAGEVGEGYREVFDPSIYVRFPLLNDDGTPQTATDGAAGSTRSLLVWTTTPWTIPSNMMSAVRHDLQYSVVKIGDSDDELIIATDLVPTIAEKTKQELPTIATMTGAELIGKRYLPPLPEIRDTLGDTTGTISASGATAPHFWHVVDADFVTTDSGTGIVHMAAAFGEADYASFIQYADQFTEETRPQLFCPVGPDGKFIEPAPPFIRGIWVKDADKPITRHLKELGVLFHQEQYKHDYPFCWRADRDPLIQYPRESWFIRTTQFRDDMLQNNRAIGWQPEHIRDGRFGKFLESNVDWALSRERFWGTPLPIWVCDKTGKMEAIGCYDELMDKPGVDGTQVWEDARKENPELVDDLKVHKPYIDAVTYASPFDSEGRMRRVTEVIDCWYDSGAMPFAQWGYPHVKPDQDDAIGFANQFPADFISEAVDQTRGWFYSQLAISTMLFGQQQVDPHPFKNCIVLGLMESEWFESKEDGTVFSTEDDARAALGKAYVKKVGKMSKRLRNYRSPDEIFDAYGADALRWYLFSGQAPWNGILYSERAIRDSIPEFLLRLYNVFSFFNIYAEIDAFNPAEGMDAIDDTTLHNLSAECFANARGYRTEDQRPEIDRWILSELHQTIQRVTETMDALDNYRASVAINEFVDSLSNWYLRRSRDRFWESDKSSPEKLDAYWTVYECLLRTAQMIAPFVPFLAERLWQHLRQPFSSAATATSVHLCDYPLPDHALIDTRLSANMRLLREIASQGRAARAEAKLKVRQPLSAVRVILTDDSTMQWLSHHDALVKEELNVKNVQYTTDGGEYVSYTVVPNFKRLGPRVGRQMPLVKQLLGAADGADLLQQLERNGKIDIDLEGNALTLDNEDIGVRLNARTGWAAAQGSNCVVVLSTEVTEELRREGVAKDVVRVIQ